MKLRPGEWHATTEQFVERRSEAVDVRSNVDVVAVQALFGSHVVQRAHYLTGFRDS